MGFRVLALFVFLFSSISLSKSENFVGCFTTSSQKTNILYTPNNSSYSSILKFSIKNLRFISTTSKPRYIITPKDESDIQAAVICSEKNDLQVRVRSGGHDFEGLSYTSMKPFILIDLISFRKVIVDMKDKTAWVQAGATVGEVYYRIAEKTNSYSFPAGFYPTVGVGGLISGGGIGALMRKYGTSADNVINAYVVDVNGRLLDREAMGEDLFWAIRGGNGASFGVIVSWKIKLVPVPPTVTVFRVQRSLEEGATALVSKWQRITPKIDKELFIRLTIEAMQVNGARTMQFAFQSLFLGRVNQLLLLMKKNFPELALEAKDCIEMNWINATMFLSGISGAQSIDVLLNRTQQTTKYFKGKSDFVQKPIASNALEGIWKVIMQEQLSFKMLCEPLGGKMGEISESEIPFPHRAGNLFYIQHLTEWEEAGVDAAQKNIAVVRRIYNYMTPYVSMSPRAAYVNSRDLDLGMNKDVNTSYNQASIWGKKYFKSNFERLAIVKNKVDPENFFWNEQSIPPLSLVKEM